MRVIIVDDEPLARRRIRALLKDEPDVSVVAECADGDDAVTAIRRERPDLVFLDVQMPRMDGFGVVRELGPGSAPRIIFVTAYDDHAIQAFEVEALDYLLKPIDRERFARSVSRARTQLGDTDLARKLDALLERVQPGAPADSRIGIRTEGKIFFLSPREIDWIEADGNRARVHAGGVVHMVRDSLTHLEERLAGADFLRVHRSALVNLARVREIQPWFQGDYVLILADGTRVSTGRSYREKVRTLVQDAL